MYTMDKSSIKDLLEKEFPGKNVTLLPSEVICEIEPTQEHPSWSEAIAYIKKSELHHHNRMEERYTIEQGVLTVVVDDKEHTLKEGDKFVVRPPSVHWAYGEWVRVRVYTEPGWTPEDHILEK